MQKNCFIQNFTKFMKILNTQVKVLHSSRPVNRPHAVSILISSISFFDQKSNQNKNKVVTKLKIYMKLLKHTKECVFETPSFSWFLIILVYLISNFLNQNFKFTRYFLEATDFMVKMDIRYWIIWFWQLRICPIFHLVVHLGWE